MITYYLVVDASDRYLAPFSGPITPDSARWTTDDTHTWFSTDLNRARFVAFVLQAIVEVRKAYD